MFEQKIAETIEFFLAETIGTRDTIAYQDITDAQVLPLAIKQLFGRHVEEWWDEEKRRIASSPHFDYSPQYCLSKIEELGEFVRPHATFSRDEYRSFLDQYVKRLFNYTFRPQYTLASMIFAVHKEQPVETILEDMSLFTDYPYLTHFLTEWTRNKHIPFLDREQFTEILSKLDLETIKKLDCKNLANLTKPMFDLYDLHRQDEDKMLPMEAVILFFNDKQAFSIEKRLEKERVSRDHITMHDLVLILGDVDYAIDSEISSLVSRHLGTALNMKDLELPPEFTIDAEPTPVATEEAVLPEYRFAEEIKPVEPEVSIDQDLGFSLDDVLLDHESTSPIVTETPREIEELPAEFMLTGEDDTSSPTTPAVDDSAMEIPSFLLHDEETPMPAATEEPSLDNLNLVLKESEVEPVPMVEPESLPTPSFDADTAVVTPSVPPPVPGHLPDLREVIPSSDRSKFIKKLFKKNDELYESTIDRLNGLATWREANETIDEVFIANAVDTYSKYAVAFYDIVYKRYTIKM